MPPQAGPILGVECVPRRIPPHTSQPADSLSHLPSRFSGVVEQDGVGAGAERWKKGDEVFGLAYGGAYAEYISVSGSMLLPKPSHLSHEECAGIPEVSPCLAWMRSLESSADSVEIQNFLTGD